MLSRIKFEIAPLVNEMLDHLPESIWTSTTTTFLDPGMAGGQFVREIERRLLEAGHSKKNISGRVFGCEEYEHQVQYALNKYKLLGNYVVTNFLEQDFKGMKFDVIVGNPPFNSNKKISDEATGNGGTGGNSRLYKHFRTKSLQLLKPNGYLAFVSLKNIIKDLYKDNNQVDVVNLMTEKDYWSGANYNTLYFIERASVKNSQPVLDGGICAKLFGTAEWKYNEFNNTESRKNTGEIKAVVNLPKVANNFSIETSLVKTALNPAPRFAFTLLESIKSYTVTELPFCGSMCGCVTLDSMSDAIALKKFIENNKGLKYFFNAMKLKGYAKDILRYTKKIDLTQVKTGLEYPVEWNLTKEEIEYIESNTK
jgi:hypothetical protein